MQIYFTSHSFLNPLIRIKIKWEIIQLVFVGTKYVNSKNSRLKSDILYLLQGEGGPVSALFAPDKGVFVDGRVVGVARVCHREN